MTPLVLSGEVSRPPDEVFSYITDPTRFAEWQQDVVSTRMEQGATDKAGSRYTTVRRLGRRENSLTAEITAVDVPRTWSSRGIDGPVRSIVDVSVEPLGERRSRFTISLDFEGHGIGKVLVPLVVRRQARDETPGNRRLLLERLDNGG